MLYSVGNSGMIQPRKFMMDKVFKNKYQKELANEKKYLYFKVLSNIKSKFQTNKEVTQELFNSNDKPKTPSKAMGLSQSMYKVEKINKKLYRLQPKDNNNPSYLMESPEEELKGFRRSYSRNIEASNRAILKRRNTQHVIQPFSSENNIKPRLKQLMRQHRESQHQYKNKKMEKYVKTQEMEVWDQLSGKLINLRRRSHNPSVPNI